MKKHNMLWMMLACAIPLLLILLLPAFGIKSEYTSFIAIVLMFGAHLFMMMGHGHGEEHDSKDKSRGEKHEHH